MGSCKEKEKVVRYLRYLHCYIGRVRTHNLRDDRNLRTNIGHISHNACIIGTHRVSLHTMLICIQTSTNTWCTMLDSMHPSHVKGKAERSAPLPEKNGYREQIELNPETHPRTPCIYQEGAIPPQATIYKLKQRIVSCHTVDGRYQEDFTVM